jgi:fucose permease
MQKRRYTAVLFTVYGNMVLYGFIQTMRGIVYPLIKNTYGASYNQQGLIVSLASFAAVISCAAAGIILNRMGFKKSMMFGFGFIITGMIAFCFSGNFWIAGGLIILIQLGLGFFEIGINGIGVKTFTKKSALMMSLLHFFYGVGAALGPWFGGLIANNQKLGWRYMYTFALAPVFVMLLSTLIWGPGSVEKESPVSPAEEASVSPGQTKPGFRWAIANPLVWRFALCLGLVSAVEFGATNWSGLYLQDVFGMDPKTTGANFISLYFLLYTVSRLLGGFFIEKAGYFRSILAAIFITLILLIIGFSLGRQGIWVLPFTGLFLGITFPTVLAMSIGVFREKAQAASSAIIVIAFSLNGIIQYLIGLINRYIGEAWGYRSCILYGVILIFMLFRLKKNIPAYA